MADNLALTFAHLPKSRISDLLRSTLSVQPSGKKPLTWEDAFARVAAELYLNKKYWLRSHRATVFFTIQKLAFYGTQKRLW